MKRVGYLYEKMCDVDFIKTAIRNAAKGKTDRLYVKAILSDIDGYARKIKAMLETETIKLSPSEHIEIYDACEIWVNDLDGKSKEEIADNNGASLRDEWFVEA